MAVFHYSFKRILRIAVALASLFMPLVAIAQSDAINSSLDNLNTVATNVYPTSTTIFDFANRVVTTFFALLAVMFIGMMLFAGYNWMTAMGESEKVDKAKDTLISSVIGIIIILAAYAITRFVISSLANTVGIF